MSNDFPSVIRAHQNAVDEMDEAVAAFLGINRTDGRCLDVIDRRGTVGAGELAAATGLSTGATTTALDRLERAGLVRRVRDAGDRRRVLVELTGEARRRIAQVFDPVAAEGAGLLAGYAPAELAAVRRFLEDDTAFQRRQAARVRAMVSGRGTEPACGPEPVIS